jgi:putative phage-type endonuclease
MAARVPVVPGEHAELVLPASASEADWLTARTAGVGGSEVAALVGASKWSTPFDVFRNKARGWVTPAFEGNVATEWGHRLEDAVARKVADELGLVARTGGGLWRHRGHPVALVTPDRIATRRRSWTAVGVIECKTAGDGDGWEDGGAPLAYQAQVIWQLGVLGLNVGWLGCLELGPARSFHLVEVKFDSEWFHELVEAAERFWADHVVTGEPPMIDLTHPRTAELLKEIHPRAVAESIELPEEAAEWIDEYHAAKEAAEAAKARLDEIKNWLRFHLGEAGAGYLGDQKVVGYTDVTTSRVDVTKLRENFPDIAVSCVVTSTSRRLTVNRKSPK